MKHHGVSVHLLALPVVLTACAFHKPTAPARRPCPIDIPVVASPSNDSSIGLASPLAEVIRALGEPEDRTESPYFCVATGGSRVDGTRLTLGYPGLRLLIDKPDGGDSYRLSQLELSGDRYSLQSGLSIGATEEEVRTRMGDPPSRSVTSRGNERWSYALSDCGDFLSFEFEGQRLIMIEAGSWCCPAVGCRPGRRAF